MAVRPPARAALDAPFPGSPMCDQRGILTGRLLQLTRLYHTHSGSTHHVMEWRFLSEQHEALEWLKVRKDRSCCLVDHVTVDSDSRNPSARALYDTSLRHRSPSVGWATCLISRETLRATSSLVSAPKCLTSPPPPPPPRAFFCSSPPLPSVVSVHKIVHTLACQPFKSLSIVLYAYALYAPSFPAPC